MNRKMLFLLFLLILTPVLATAANVGHLPEGIYGGGVFGEGNYVFPNELDIRENLGVGGSLDVENNILAQGAYIGVLATVAQNAGAQELSKGDLVSLHYAAPKNTVGKVPVYLVEKTTAQTKHHVIGIVHDSFKPSGQDAITKDGFALIAGSGSIVYMKASAENGAIRSGDSLTPAGTAGHVMRATTQTTIVGKALGDLTSSTGMLAAVVQMKHTIAKQEAVSVPIDPEPVENEVEQPIEQPDLPQLTGELVSNGEITTDAKGNTVILID